MLCHYAHRLSPNLPEISRYLADHRGQLADSTGRRPRDVTTAWLGCPAVALPVAPTHLRVPPLSLPHSTLQIPRMSAPPSSPASPPAYRDSLDLHAGQSSHLPEGWIREFDKKSVFSSDPPSFYVAERLGTAGSTSRFYYVDTLAKPPRSTWRAAFADPKTLPPPAFKKVEEEEVGLMGISASLKNKLLGGTNAERQLHKARREDLVRRLPCYLRSLTP